MCGFSSPSRVSPWSSKVWSDSSSVASSEHGSQGDAWRYPVLMGCVSPLDAWRSSERNPESGKRGITFKFQEAHADQPIQLPCGRCIGCRVARARQWSVRLLHEAKLHEHNSFLTLTYSAENDPGELQKRDVQLFLKRLRNESDARFRYFCVGEYGDAFGRPHYHALLFGFRWPDLRYWKGAGASRQYRSELLESVWTRGYSTVGSVTSASAQYVSKYCVKTRSDSAREREFALMSRRPGIGAGWIDKYGREACPRDFVVVGGRKRVGVPRYYVDRVPEVARDELRRNRRARAAAHADPDDLDGWVEVSKRNRQIADYMLVTLDAAEKRRESR